VDIRALKLCRTAVPRCPTSHSLPALSQSSLLVTYELLKSTEFATPVAFNFLDFSIFRTLATITQVPKNAAVCFQQITDSFGSLLRTFFHVDLLLSTSSGLFGQKHRGWGPVLRGRRYSWLQM
jgi:hypothetical protein